MKRIWILAAFFAATMAGAQTGPLSAAVTGPSFIGNATIFDIRATAFAGGAKCDGSTNDTPAIQAAINAANAAGGGIVTGPNNGAVCAISTTTSISLLANVTLRGFSVAPPSGQSMTVAPFISNNLSSSCPTPLISNITIENMVINDRNMEVVPGASGMTLYCVTNFHANRVTISNTGWEGIQIESSTSSEVSKSNFYSIWGDCIISEVSDSITYEGNVCDAQNSATDGGFSAGRAATNVKIINNVVKGLNATGGTSPFAIECAGCNNVLISGNIVQAGYSAAGNGIRAYNYVSTDAWNFTIANNIIGAAPSGGYCINILEPNAGHQTATNIIAGNQCNGTASTNGGFYIDGYSVKVAGNTISIPNASASCTWVDGPGASPTSNIDFEWNTFVGCGTAVGGMTASNISNITIGPQVLQGVTTLMNGTNYSYLSAIQVQSPVAFPQGINANSSGFVNINSGVVGTGGSTVVSALSTPTQMVGTNANFGLLRVRDITNTGTALFLIDPNQGVQLIGTSQITGLGAAQITFASGHWNIALSSGSVPRTLGWGIFD